MKKFFTLIAVAVMAFAAQANELTVADGNKSDNFLPLCGAYYDTGSMSQQIYPADMLADMAGAEITEVTFTTLGAYYEAMGYSYDVVNYYRPDYYIQFSGGEIELSLLEVDQAGFTDVVAVTGATLVAKTTPVLGSSELTFVFDEPFQYNGGNLMVQVVVSTLGSWGDTFFWGIFMDYYSNYYSYYNLSGILKENIGAFLPMATFTYEPVGEVPPTPGGKTDAPSSSKENYAYNDGNLVYNAYTVTLIETEPSDIYYRVGVLVEGDYVYGDWMLYTGELNFSDEGTYMIEAYAIAPGKTESDHIWDGFTVSKMVDVEELMAGKTVSSVRYYNVAGQEMAQPSGLTIMVTTFTDGTTSAVKVVK